jgi:Transposase DDE domain
MQDTTRDVLFLRADSIGIDGGVCTLRRSAGVVGYSFNYLVLTTPMPHKYNTDQHHRIPKKSFKAQNWSAYEAGLRRRGGVTLWIEDAALRCWPSCGPGGQARYAGAAIQTSLMMCTAFKLPSRQTDALMTVLALMDLTISAPDHTTVSRRAVMLPVIRTTPVPRGP